MNPIIEDLARRAGFCGTGFANTQFGTTRETALENFAQLIVQQCADAADMFPPESVYVGDYIMESMGYQPHKDR